MGDLALSMRKMSWLSLVIFWAMTKMGIESQPTRARFSTDVHGYYGSDKPDLHCMEPTTSLRLLFQL